MARSQAALLAPLLRTVCVATPEERMPGLDSACDHQHAKGTGMGATRRGNHTGEGSFPRARGRTMHRHYWMLAVNLLASLVVMYLVMFAMIDGTGDFYNNLNMLWMALAMVSPMAMLMLLTMGSMYENKRLNLALHAGFALLFAGAIAATRVQAGIGDDQFLRSMIPHHSGAILMCREASIEDAEIADLCARIRRTQREEIEQMRAILARI